MPAHSPARPSSLAVCTPGARASLGRKHADPAPSVLASQAQEQSEPAQDASASESQQQGDSARTGKRPPRRLLRELGIAGWDQIEPAILAAVAAELPLLLVGPHGSAKTMLLKRLAECLGLEHRQYNASLLNFDDLVGFPVPENGKIVYLQTPATIWEAESVFFDEISRCRPDLQNKLFPIVHDRVVQGVPLARLRHRWAAMNPPPDTDDKSGACNYAGAEPLDVALADRFAFVVTVPSFGDLGRDDQLLVLQRDARPTDDAAEVVRGMVAAVREAIARNTGQWRTAVAEYVHVAAAKLAEAGHPVSTRRAVQLTANIGAVLAVLDATSTGHALEDACYCALRHSLPDIAWGNPVSGSAILAIHRAAWGIARLEAGSPLKAIHAERRPMRRIALALSSGLDDLQAAQVIADSYAMLDMPARLATAPLLMPHLVQRPGFPLGAVEAVAHDYALVAAQGEQAVVVRNDGNDWRREIISRDLPALDRGSVRGQVLTNVGLTLAGNDEQFSFADAERGYDEAAAALSGLDDRATDSQDAEADALVAPAGGAL
jgi:MoxR-like ATPase